MFQCRERDGKVLDGESRRVENRDLAARATTLGGARQDIPQLNHVVTTQHAGLDRVDEFAVVARLLPVVAEEPYARQFLHRDFRLSRAVGSHEARLLARAAGTSLPQDGSA